eukprot:365744-Chlamydomonas_euryale.AAC.21
MIGARRLADRLRRRVRRRVCHLAARQRRRPAMELARRRSRHQCGFPRGTLRAVAGEGIDLGGEASCGGGVDDASIDWVEGGIDGGGGCGGCGGGRAAIAPREQPSA